MLRIAIFGYGNLGRGAAAAALAATDMELCGIFTRRDPAALGGVPDGVPVYAADSAAAHKGEIDALILCGGSADDLPRQTPQLARDFCVVDSFDTHAKIPAHFAAVDAAARAGGKVALISAGWDPGLFSLARLYAEAVLPKGTTYTFWGAGVSEGHSDAARRVPGALDARAYTLPVVDALTAVRRGEVPPLSPREMHRRVCYVVPAPGADLAAITRAICTMPAYFADYDTEVHFITAEEMARDHAALPPSPAACSSPVRAPSAAPPRAARSAAARSLTSRPPTFCPTPPAPAKRCCEANEPDDIRSLQKRERRRIHI